LRTEDNSAIVWSAYFQKSDLEKEIIDNRVDLRAMGNSPDAFVAEKSKSMRAIN